MKMMKRNALLLILLLTSAGQSQQRMKYPETPWGQIDYAWTDLSPEKCKPMKSLQANELRACPPVAGYQLLYGGPKESPQIVIVFPNRKRHVLHYWDLKAGNFISLARQVTWKLAHRRSGGITPLSLLLQAEIKLDEFTRFQNPYTIVAKVTRKEVCVVGRVPVSGSSAAEIAGLSTWARTKRCVGLDNVGERDWLGVVFGLSATGRYEEAKAALKKIKCPATRTVGYTDIARAQAKSEIRRQLVLH